MFGKIAVRNISGEILKALEILAEKHERSVEGEARFALRSWVEPVFMERERSARILQVSSRLKDVLERVNKVATGIPEIKPSHIAQKIGENCASEAEGWFSGICEPSFNQLAAISAFLGCQTSWLQHGDGAAFPVEYARIPENPSEGLEWFLSPHQWGEVSHIYLIRDLSESGRFAVVKQFADWRCNTYRTPYCFSDIVGGGGESSLARLFILLEFLHGHWTDKSATYLVSSYLVEKENFDLILSGNMHPLSVLNASKGASWWEDIWDAEHYRNYEYWPGWKKLCERIQRALEASSSMQEQLREIRS